LVFEKEKRNNKIILIAGVAAAVVGLAVFFIANRTAGILFLCIGVALFVIGFSIWNVFYKVEMMESLKSRDKNK